MQLPCFQSGPQPIIGSCQCMCHSTSWHRTEYTWVWDTACSFAAPVRGHSIGSFTVFWAKCVECLAPTFKGAYLRYQRTHILHRQPVYEALSPYKRAIIYHSVYPALPQH